MEMQTPFSIPFIPDLAKDYIDRALDSNIQQGGGSFSGLAQRRIQDIYSGYQSFLTPSCTASLELSLMLHNVGPGDEVILPSFNFPSAATAVTRLFATPVFADIESHSGNLNLSTVDSAITARTKAIIWVNYAGNELESTKLKKLAQNKDLALIEDAAHNFGILTDSQREQISDYVTFSFHASKNIQCGEGGALLVKSREVAERAQIMCEKGTNRYLFERGQVSKYNWVDKGGSFLLAEINSAILLAQIESFGAIQKDRRDTIDFYTKEISPYIRDGWSILRGTERAAHIFALIAPDSTSRDELLKYLNEHGIKAVSHYEDLASSPAGIRYGKTISCDESKKFASRIVRLPMFVGMRGWQKSLVIERLNLFLDKAF